MQKLIATAEKLESGGKAEAVSIFPVQPWMDIAEMGCSVIVVTKAIAALRKNRPIRSPNDVGQKSEYEAKLTPVPEAIEAALKMKGGPVVLSESSDSTGSGSPGDSTGPQSTFCGHSSPDLPRFLVDPDAVDMAIRAGPAPQSG